MTPWKLEDNLAMGKTAVVSLYLERQSIKTNYEEKIINFIKCSL